MQTWLRSLPPGSTTAHTDTYHGRFVTLVPDELVVQVDEFETADPVLNGEMTSTITLADADGDTDLVAAREALPAGVSPADTRAGNARRSPSDLPVRWGSRVGGPMTWP